MLDADTKLEEKFELILTDYMRYYFMNESNTRNAPLGTKKKYLDESESIYISPLVANKKLQIKSE